MKKLFLILFFCGFCFGEIFEDCTKTLKNIIHNPSKAPTNEILQNTKAVLIFPNFKSGGLIFGAKFGNGLIAIKSNGDWEYKAVDIGGANVGFQIGFSVKDLVIFIHNENLINQILEQNLNFSGDSSSVFGTKSKGGESINLTDEDLYTFSSAKGLFAGVNLGGTSIKLSKNQDFSLENSYKLTEILSSF